MPVDLGGLPIDYIALNTLLNKESVKSKFNPKTDFQRKIGRPIVLSDAAHSIGSLIDGVPTPLFSDFSVFSFHSVKNITTGEGGAITFKIFDELQDGLILKELRLLSLNGQNKTAFEKNSIGGWKYDITTNGLKVNMPDINAAIGLAQITGDPRYTFGTLYLTDGFPLVVMGLGLFAVPEIVSLLQSKTTVAGGGKLKTGWLLGMKDAIKNWFLIIRCSTVGVLVGALPGLGGTVVDWIAYSHAKQTLKNPETLGTGDIRGVIAPEAANNAKEGGAFSFRYADNPAEKHFTSCLFENEFAPFSERQTASNLTPSPNRTAA